MPLLPRVGFREFLEITEGFSVSEILRFDDKVVIVTGAGRGLGRAYALEFARRGARVVVNDLGGTSAGGGSSSEPASETVSAIVAAGGSAVTSFEDISTQEGGESLVETALTAFGRVDVVVNNAGIAGEFAFEDSTNAVFERFWRVHLLGHVNVTRAAWPHLVAQKSGRVINTTSGAALRGMLGQAAYGAAKGAIGGLTTTLALEGAPHGIVVNAIAPAAFTRMQDEVVTDEAFRAAAQKMMKVELAVPAVVLLAHDSVSVTGQTFETASGRVGRVVTGAVPGFYDAELTVESLSAHWAVAVGDNGGLLVPPDAMRASSSLLEAAMGQSGDIA